MTKAKRQGKSDGVTRSEGFLIRPIRWPQAKRLATNKIGEARMNTAPRSATRHNGLSNAMYNSMFKEVVTFPELQEVGQKQNMSFMKDRVATAGGQTLVCLRTGAHRICVVSEALSRRKEGYTIKKVDVGGPHANKVCAHLLGVGKNTPYVVHCWENGDYGLWFAYNPTHGLLIDSTYHKTVDIGTADVSEASLLKLAAGCKQFALYAIAHTPPRG